MSKAVHIRCAYVDDDDAKRVSGCIQVVAMDDFIHANGEETVLFYSDVDSLWYTVRKRDLHDFRIGDEP